MAQDITDPVLSDAVHNLLTLHGYSATWHVDGACWIVYKDTNPRHSFTVDRFGGLGYWQDALEWYMDSLRDGQYSHKIYPGSVKRAK